METLKFNIDSATLLKSVSDDQLAIAEVYVCHDGNNSHNMPITLESLKEASSTILNKFLVADYDGYDFLDHTKTQRILGFFPAENDLRFIEKDGKTYFVANAIISKVYVPWAYDLFASENYKSVSMEISVLETEEIDDLTYIKKFVFNGVTILGDKVNPACAGSNAQIFKFSQEEFIESATKFYHNFSHKSKEDFSKYDGIDFKIPKSVKENAKRGLELRKEYKRGGTSVGVNSANYLISNDSITPEKVRHVVKYFPRHKGDNLSEKNPPSNGWIAWLLWGGTEGMNWSQSIVDRMNKIDEKDFSVGEELGKEESIKINNSKESAIMSEAWNGQGADFLNKLLKASNHESLINEAYLITDKSGDVSVNDVHYPHHSIKDGELVVNRKGVISAFQRAKQQGITGEPINHLKRHYKELGLDTENFTEGGKPLDKAKRMEMASKMECMEKYAMMDIDMEYAYAIDKESKMMYAIPYKMSESEEFEFAMEDMKKAKMACKYEMMADDEEEDKEVYMAMGKMAKMKGFNDDQNVEAVAQTEENEKESDKMKEEAEEADDKDDDSDDDVKMAMKDMEVKMAEMAKENEELKKFKEEVEMAQKQAKVDMESHMMAEKVNAEFAETWKAKVNEFDNVDAWANAMKAMAFSLVVEKKETETKTFSRIDIPTLHDDKHETKTKKFWEM